MGTSFALSLKVFSVNIPTDRAQKSRGKDVLVQYRDEAECMGETRWCVLMSLAVVLRRLFCRIENAVRGMGYYHTEDPVLALTPCTACSQPDPMERVFLGG